MVMVSPGWERGNSARERVRRFLAPHAPRSFVGELAHRASEAAALLAFWGLVQVWADPVYPFDAVIIGVLSFGGALAAGAALWLLGRWARHGR